MEKKFKKKKDFRPLEIWGHKVREEEKKNHGAAAGFE